MANLLNLERVSKAYGVRPLLTMLKALNEQIKARGLFRSFILLPWAMPGFVAFLAWKLLLMPIGGGINLVLTETGLHTGIIDWLGQKSTAMPAVITATVWRGFPFWVISFLAALQTAATYTLRGDMLELRTADGALAVTLKPAG